MNPCQVTIMTNEYPPFVYGGAGVHVTYLSKALAKIMSVEVRAFGNQKNLERNPAVKGYQGWKEMEQKTDPHFSKVLEPFSKNLAMVKEPITSDLVHCHTWYTLMGGFLAKTLYRLPLITTVHSLEPLRPWKQEQLGNAYYLSTWMEATGLQNADKIVAVSQEMKADILKLYPIPEERIEVIYNGVDLNEFQPTHSTKTLEDFGITQEYLLFVGRVSRQKGIIHLLDALDWLPENIQVVCCAGAPDTKEIKTDINKKIKGKKNVVWIDQMLAKTQLVELYSHAAVFVCPSIYEPFGIINLEAMACRTPVVASAVGGIKEVVVPGVTGLLIEPGKPQAIAEAVSYLLANPAYRKKLGKQGRERVESMFTWDAIARQTKEMYARVLRSR
jgi:starch synthase